MAKTNTLTVVKPDTQTDAKPEVRWIERPLSDQWLFHGQDEGGRRGWFVRFDVTGLYTRRVGPFLTRDAAVECLDELLAEIGIGSLCDLENSMRGTQRYVIEGVPRLKSR